MDTDAWKQTGSWHVMHMRGRAQERITVMRPIIVRETQIVEVSPPVMWTREINMPPKEWFRGEWFPAARQREEQEKLKARERRMERIKTAIAKTIVGIFFVGGSLAGYIGLLMLVGTP